MPHGTPDWGSGKPTATTYASTDMAELAVRLGSIDTFDRLGNVIWMSSFEHGTLGLTPYGTGTDAEVYPSTEYPLSGGLHLVLKTGNLIGNYAGIMKALHFPVLGGIGVEISFNPVANMGDFWAVMQQADGTTMSVWRAKYDHQAGTLEVFVTGGGWQTIGTPGIAYTEPGRYCSLKLVVDCLKGKYHHVTFNAYRYDASAYAPFTQADPTRPYLDVGAFAYTAIAENLEVNIANMIVTQNEP